MQNISFRQFMITYNFRQYNDNGETENDKMDCSTIRINYPTNEEETCHHWFEFGMYDYECDLERIKHFETIFSEHHLNMYISSIYHKNELNMLEIYLTKDRYNNEL